MCSFGYEYGELVGTEIMQYVAPDCHDTILAHIRNGYERPYEPWCSHRTALRIPVEIEGRTMPYKGTTPPRGDQGTSAGAAVSRARIDYLAHYDMLYGTAERALLLDRLEFVIASARRRGTQVGVLFIDLDHFKRVNDFARPRRRRRASRSSPAHPGLAQMVDVVSRHGGDEFSWCS